MERKNPPQLSPKVHPIGYMAGNAYLWSIVICLMQLSKNLLAPVLSALMILAGCRKEAVSPVAPKPFPSDGNKDLTVAPGDVFSATATAP